MTTPVYKVNFVPEPYSSSAVQAAAQSPSLDQEQQNDIDNLPCLLPLNAKPMAIHGPVLYPHLKRNGKVVIKPLIQTENGAFYTPGTSLNSQGHALSRHQQALEEAAFQPNAPENLTDLTALPNLVNQDLPPSQRDLPLSQRTECSTNNNSLNSQTFSYIKPQEQDSGLTLLQKKQVEQEILEPSNDHQQYVVSTVSSASPAPAASHLETPKAPAIPHAPTVVQNDEHPRVAESQKHSCCVIM